VIYPGESHEINRPSFVPDRMERYLAWYGEHLGVSPAVPSTGGR
jgi:dipeptidyl aminopeptidase/acylaminoacyl peptidase